MPKLTLTPGLLSMHIIAQYHGAVYLRLPRELQRGAKGGCDCDACKWKPITERGMWDTLAIPLEPTSRSYAHTYSWTVHCPDGEPVERLKAACKKWDVEKLGARSPAIG